MAQFEAMYEGECSQCEGRIHTGDLVTYIDDAVAHVDCKEPPAAVRKEAVCPWCWLVFPCGCDTYEV